MSNKGIDHLKELVGTLSKSEKRLLSIKINVLNKEGNIKYLQYLEWVLSGKEFLKEGKNWNENQEHNYKTEAIDFIIDTLQLESTNENREEYLKHKLQKVRFFQKKGLLHAANNIANKVYEEAKVSGYYEVMIEALQLKEKLWITIQEEKAGFSTFLEQLSQIQQEKKQTIDNFLLYEELFSYHRKQFAIIRKDRYARTEIGLPKVDEIINLPIIAKAVNSSEFKIQFLGYSIQAIYFISTGYPEKSYPFFRAIIQLYQQYPHQQKLNPNEYIVQIYNFVLNAQRIREYDTFFHEIMQTFQQLSLAHANHLPSYYCMYLVWKTTLADTDALKKITQEIELEHAKKKLQFHSAYIEADLYFDMFQAYFIMGEYKKALTWLNIILYDEKFKKIDDIYSVSRLLQLAVHWELKNNLLLESLISSIKRELMVKQKPFQFEKIFLKNFEKLLKQKDHNGIKKVAEKWHLEIIDLMDIPKENSVMNYFDFIEWLTSLSTKTK